MVSRVPYPHIVNQVFRGQRSFGHLVAVIFTLVAVMVVRGYAVPIIFGAFVLYGPIRLRLGAGGPAAGSRKNRCSEIWI